MGIHAGAARAHTHRTSRRGRRSVLGLLVVGALLLAYPAPAQAASPVAYDQVWDFQMNTPELLSMTASDVDEDPLTYAVLTQPTHGTLSACTDSYCRYSPQTGYSGLDSFTFRASDGTSVSNTATITIRVNDPGTGATYSSAATVAPGDPVTITLEGYDYDGQNLAFSIVDPPTRGTLGAL